MPDEEPEPASCPNTISQMLQLKKYT
jgi:hypothetical protein